MDGNFDGWIPVNELWEYDSADSPTFTFTVAGDKTNKYSPGMRIKLTQTSAKYFIITKVAYSSPDTTITVYGGTDYTLANAGIEFPYYATVKAPHGFPLDPNKWTIEVTDNTAQTTSSPTATTWYNAKTITIPIGLWRVNYQVALGGYGSSGLIHALATLSTANNSESDTDFTSSVLHFSQGAGDVGTGATANREKVLSLTSETNYYLNYQAVTANSTDVGFAGNSSKTIIRAVCAYL